MPQCQHSRLRELFRRLMGRLTRRVRPEPGPPPVDPYAYVTAPRKPRPSNRSGAAVAELPEDWYGTSNDCRTSGRKLFYPL